MSATDVIYDAVIVGAGVSSALIAKQLGLAGKRVLILEAGDGIPTNIDGFMERFYMSSAKVPEIPYTPDLFQPNGGGLTDPTTLNAGRPTVLTLDKSNWKNPKEAYLIQKGPLAFASTYERIAGGTMRHWLGTSLRFVPNDFKMKTVYKQEVDWPFGYDELESWYGAAEHEIGVSANVADQAYLGITFPPGYSYPMQTIPPSLVDEAVTTGIAGMSIDNIPLSVTETPAGRNSQPYQSRRVCAGNTNCIPICPIQAKYDPSITLNDALDTGNVELRSKCVVNDVLIDANGRVTQVNYITYETAGGRPTGTGTAKGKIFVLAAHAIETPKLMLMSKNGGRTAKGLGNSSGQVGLNLMDHPLYLAWAQTADPVYPYRGPLATSGIENLRDGAFRSERAAYRIEIGNEGWNFSITDPYTTGLDFINGMNSSGLNGNKETLFGSALTAAYNNAFTRQFRLGFLVEQSPESYSTVTLSDIKDHLGLPRPQINYNLSDYTKKGLISARDTADRIFKQMGATQFTTAADPASPTVFEVPGEPDPKRKYINFYGSGHIVGTCCMGTTKDNSVVDRDLRSWDHKNLFIAGSTVFPTVATGNPTLTIAALALRAADTILKTDLKGA
jgi:choline dehydrogenase-like flavoprotein